MENGGPKPSIFHNSKETSAQLRGRYADENLLYILILIYQYYL
jgi:hypothetical protein